MLRSVGNYQVIRIVRGHQMPPLLLPRVSMFPLLKEEALSRTDGSRLKVQYGCDLWIWMMRWYYLWNEQNGNFPGG